MADNNDLYSTLLSKATGIGAAPPAEMESPRNLLNQGVDAFKGFTGLGDQGPAGATATNAGQLLGAAMPLGGALKKITSIEHPAMQELLWLLGNTKPASEESALAQALSQRTTSSLVKPTKEIILPEGFTLPGYERTGSATAYGKKAVWSPPELAKPVGPPALTGRPVSGPDNKSAFSRLARAGLSEDIVREIRGIGNFNTAKKAFPNISNGTLQGILAGDTFSWIK